MMNASETHPAQGAVSASTANGTAASWLLESIAAAAVIVLAIVGLSGVLPNVLAPVATIIVGAGFLMQGGAENWGQRSRVAGAAEEAQATTGGGVTAEFLGGLAGMVLGILALFNIAVPTLLSAALIVFGATVLLGSATRAQVSWMFGFPVSLQQSGGQTVAVGAGGVLLVGSAALVLGILAVIGLATLTLILVGLLCLGAGGLFSGGRLLAAASRPGSAA